MSWSYDEKTGLVDENKAVDIVYLDFSKAFNAICQKIVTELMKCGLDEEAVRWIEKLSECLGLKSGDQWHNV